ncbi:MAG: membrane protein insertion efficiency factor YidD [Rhodospirillaceae bacterium]|nr:membrane protein insertion efficiency factor YidD [Rhodospirillaceae bacterium]
MIARTLGIILRTAIKVYQWTLSPLIGPVCRYTPSCSHYAAEAILRHGPFKGIWLAAHRIVRCHPWGESGYDPVPDAAVHDHSNPRSSGHTHAHG